MGRLVLRPPVIEFQVHSRSEVAHLKVGLFTYSVEGIPFDEVLGLAQESGIEAVELGVGGGSPSPGLDAEMLLTDSARRAHVQDSVAGHGMVISALNASCNPLHPNLERRTRNLDFLKTAIRLGAKMGVTRVITSAGCPGESERSLHPAFVVESEGSDEVLEWQWKEVAEPIWKEIGSYATEHGVRICIEILPGRLAYNTDSFLRLRNLVGEAVGANFDPSHLIWQGMDPNVVARELTGCIYHAHAKDTVINPREMSRNGMIETREDRSSRSWSFCTVGDGHDAVYWRSVVISMQAAGYDDVWSIEHEDSTLDERSAIRRNASFIRGLL
jgi:sugar phosphate isomerase/epimerase